MIHWRKSIDGDVEDEITAHLAMVRDELIAGGMSEADATREARRRTPATLGLHLEGPFIDPRRRGAHELKYIRDLAPDDVETIVDADCGAVMLTLAPNRVGRESIAELARRGVLVSLGHSEASYEEARAAIQAGAVLPRCATYFIIPDD